MESVGKVIGDATYLHWEALPDAPSELREAAADAVDISGLEPLTDFNVVKVQRGKRVVSLLRYASFFTTLFPELERSWIVDLDKRQAVTREHGKAGNPPILHRKELLLSLKHPRQAHYQSITSYLEEAGLYEAAHRIGYKVQWESRLALNGLEVHGEALASTIRPTIDGERAYVLRHRTAIRRFTLSSPFQLLSRAGLLDGKMTIFDYGCGYGDDVKSLEGAGLEARGWDPHFAPDEEIVPSDIVNLGFVLNVIEDPRERSEVLRRAFKVANKLLVVSVIRTGFNKKTARIYGDGVVTRRQTFQRTFAPGELATLVHRVLGVSPLSGVPGIVLIPKSEPLWRLLEATRGQWARIEASEEWRSRRTESAALREARESCAANVWELMLDLGRAPDENELGESLRRDISDAFGTTDRAVKFALRTQDGESYEAIREERRAEILGELAPRFIRGTRKLSSLPRDLQRDVRELLGSFKYAIQETQAALRTAANPAELDREFLSAQERGLAIRTPRGSLLFHSGNSQRLSAVLQVLLGCTRVLLNARVRSDLTKINPVGPRITFTALDDLEGKALPLSRQKVRVNLSRRDVNPVRLPLGPRTPVLVRKSLFLDKETTGFADQKRIEAVIREQLGLDPARLWYPFDTVSRGIAEAGIDLKTRSWRNR